MRRLLLIAIAVKGKRLTLAADTYACALSPSALSSQNGMSISRHIVVAVVRRSWACSRWPVRRQSLARPRWQWAMRGRMPRGSPRASAFRY
jgi:hypothetical protein